jgi:hypothetical protein
MSFATTDRQTLDSLQASVRTWQIEFFKDQVNAALIEAQFYNDDLPELRRVRWYGVRNATDIEQLWKRFVDNAGLEGEARNSMFDFYMNGATYMWLQNPTASGHYDSFINHLASSLAWPSSATALPDDVREHVGTYEELKTILKGNHWLIFMILLSLPGVKQ